MWKARPCTQTLCVGQETTGVLGKPRQLGASSGSQALGSLVEKTDKQELLPAVCVPSPSHCRQGENLGNDHGREAWGMPRKASSAQQYRIVDSDLWICRVIAIKQTSSLEEQ